MVLDHDEAFEDEEVDADDLPESMKPNNLEKSKLILFIVFLKAIFRPKTKRVFADPYSSRGAQYAFQ